MSRLGISFMGHDGYSSFCTSADTFRHGCLVFSNCLFLRRHDGTEHCVCFYSSLLTITIAHKTDSALNRRREL